MGWLKTIFKTVEVVQKIERTQRQQAERELDARMAEIAVKHQELLVKSAKWQADFDSITDLVNRARAAYKTGDLAQTEGFCKAAIDRMDSTGVGNFPYPYERLAIIYEKQKRFPEALRYAEVGRDRFPRSPASRASWDKRISRLRRKASI